MSDLLRFKFKFLNGQGEEEGFLSKKGVFDGRTLRLGSDEVPVEAVLRAQQRFNRLLLEVAAEKGTAGIALAVTSGDAGRIAGALNRRSSARWSELRIKALQEAGKGSTYRSVTCPACTCTVDVTGFARAPQVHCPYCDAIGTIDEPRPAGEAKLRCCEQCNYYAMPRPFTSFYFYFLLVIYGWRYQKKYMCHTCMRSEAWKMLFANLIFVLGVPIAIGQIIRAYKGGDLGARGFVGLDGANSLAKRRQSGAAVERYLRIANDLPAAAGVHFNRGLALVAAEEWSEAASALEASLADCANFAPAAEALLHCYQQSGQTAKADRLKAQWAPDEPSAN
jgi:hypothetical protein